jgi:hypothetical protein
VPLPFLRLQPDPYPFHRYVQCARAGPYGDHRPLQLRCDEMNGRIGLDQGFEPGILFRGPFVAAVFRERRFTLLPSPAAQQQHTALSKQPGRRKDRWQLPRARCGFVSLPSAQAGGRLSFVLCRGLVTAHKWPGVFAEARSLSHRRAFRPSEGHQVSFARRPSTAVALVLKGSFGFRLQPELDHAAVLRIFIGKRERLGRERKAFRIDR